MIDPISIRAFRDELTKIGGLGKLVSGVAGKAGGLLRAGWHGADGMPAGKINKALTLAGPAIAAPSAFSEEDKSGLGRSRAERITALAGGTLGSLALGGALARGQSRIMKALPHKMVPSTVPGGAPIMESGWGGSILGNTAFIGGSLLASGPVLTASEQLATSPFRAARGVRDVRESVAQRRQQKLQAQQAGLEG